MKTWQVPEPQCNLSLVGMHFTRWVVETGDPEYHDDGLGGYQRSPVAEVRGIFVEEVLGEGWSRTAQIVVNGRGEVEIAEYLIHPTDPEDVPPGGVTSKLMGTPFESLLRKVQDRLRGDPNAKPPYGEPLVDRPGEAGLYAPSLEPWNVNPTRVLDRSRRGREPPDLLPLARLASEYVALVEAGVRHPHPTLAARHGYSDSWSAGRINKARNRGLLTSIGSGRSGGELTEMARQLLAEDSAAAASS